MLEFNSKIENQLKQLTIIRLINNILLRIIIPIQEKIYFIGFKFKL
jgi:hypothetical protein